jgi:hypothetical protein
VTGAPIGYLVGVALVTLGTLFALVPPRWPRALGGLSFLFGPLVNELPFIAFYWLFGWTLLAISEGALDTTAGQAAFGVAIAVTVGLGVVVWRGLRARPAVARALAEGLGVGWRSELDAGPCAHPLGQLPLARILFGPLFVRRRDVERTANISYGDAGRRNLLDVYRDRSHGLGGPVLIHLHGGHFASGKRIARRGRCSTDSQATAGRVSAPTTG